MLDNEELQALIELLNRIPLTKAEAQWVRIILQRLMVAANPPDVEEEQSE